MTLDEFLTDITPVSRDWLNEICSEERVATFVVGVGTRVSQIIAEGRGETDKYAIEHAFLDRNLIIGVATRGEVRRWVYALTGRHTSDSSVLLPPRSEIGK